MDEQAGNEPDGSATDGIATRPGRRRPRGTFVAAVVVAAVVGAAGVAQAANSRGGVLASLTASSSVAATANDAVVNIVSKDAYSGSTSAGTGMILSSTGEVLTNNHVIDGATSITVTIARTGATYNASVVGTAPSVDVAVIQLTGASGLRSIPISNATVQVGQRVVASGNAGGKGGTPSVANGTVTGLNKTITASSGQGRSEQLSGLIETDAAIVAGDSGGPLATTSGQVIGMNTAASVTNGRGAANEAYAIPIATALKVADQIEAGRADETVHIGTHGFLGVQLQSRAADPRRSGFGDSYGDAVQGAQLAGVIPGGPADKAGLQAGAVITAVNGRAVTSAEDLSTIMAGTKAGAQVTVTWTDGYGSSTDTSVTLTAAPAD